MTAKIIIFFGLVAACQAGLLPVAYQTPVAYHQAPIAYHAAPHYYAAPAPTIIKTVQPTILKKVIAAEAPANYQFQYDINDAQTGDAHSQHETAENGAIRGSYELNDSDGFRRIVDYTADDVHGFQANVRREPLNVHVIKKIVAQPVVHKVIQPVVAAKYFHY